MNFPLPTGGMISHPALVANLAKSGEAILASLTPDKVHAWHMASCIPGEAGELFDTFLKGRDALYTAVDYDNIVEELGDLEFYIEGLRSGLGIERHETLSFGHFPDANDAEPIYGLPARAAEVFDATKKWVIYNKPFDRDALVAALVVMELTMACAYRFFAVDRDTALASNVTKLGVRYSGGYSDAAASARADKTGTVH